MAIHKYLDWKNWCLGLYKTSIEAFATTGLTLLTSNGLDSSGISQAIGAGHIGMSWKQAICQLGIHLENSKISIAVHILGWRIEYG